MKWWKITERVAIIGQCFSRVYWWASRKECRQLIEESKNCFACQSLPHCCWERTARECLRRAWSRHSPDWMGRHSLMSNGFDRWTQIPLWLVHPALSTHQIIGLACLPSLSAKVELPPRLFYCFALTSQFLVSKGSSSSQMPFLCAWGLHSSLSLQLELRTAQRAHMPYHNCRPSQPWNRLG